MFLTSPLIDQAITRFDRWSVSDMAISQQLAVAVRLGHRSRHCQPLGVIAIQQQLPIVISPRKKQSRDVPKLSI
jgi:hypothetical protein